MLMFHRMKLMWQRIKLFNMHIPQPNITNYTFNNSRFIFNIRHLNFERFFFILMNPKQNYSIPKIFIGHLIFNYFYFIISMFRQYLCEIAGKTIKDASHFVLGNSSVDYDTFFGSIVLAFMLSSSTKELHLPIIDCQPQEVKDRFQIAKILNILKIDHSTLLYQDTLQSIQKKATFNLYDHNSRPNISTIEYIVDHHDFVSNRTDKYLIAKMGSALTHLYFLLNPSKLFSIQPTLQQDKQYQQHFHNFFKSSPFSNIQLQKQPDLQIEQILRYGILMDTFNFDEKQQERWTIFDKKAVEFIGQNKTYEIGYQFLQNLKFNEEMNRQLSLSAALKKDYKQYKYGQLSVQYSIIYLQPQVFSQHYQESLQKWLKQPLNCDVYIMMSVFKGQFGQLKRELMFMAKDIKNVKLIQGFLNQLKMEHVETKQPWNFWKDPSATLSRKLFDKQFRKYLSETPIL